MVAPTLLFVMCDKNGEPSPLAVPFNIVGYSIDDLEKMVGVLLEQYPEDRYVLQMVMYANLPPDFQSHAAFQVMFGARDLYGTTIHTVYTHSRIGDEGLMKHKKFGDGFDSWIQNTIKHKTLNDPYLKAATEIYQVMLSLRHSKTCIT